MPGVFDDTIMNNVRYARITASDLEVIEACRAAYLHESVKKYPDGK